MSDINTFGGKRMSMWLGYPRITMGLPVRILEYKYVCIQEQDVDLQPHRAKKIRNSVHVHLHERWDPGVSNEEGFSSGRWEPRQACCISLRCS